MEQERFNIKKENGKTYIYDVNRKKYVVLTPEEWVRQQLLYYLVNELQYPASLLSIEKQIVVGSKKKRYDIVVYKHDKPWLIVECKNEKESLNENVLSQLLSYNSSLDVLFLTITNGLQIMTYDIEKTIWINGFPAYE